MEEMIVPKTFNWNTAQRIQMGVAIKAKSGEKPFSKEEQLKRFEEKQIINTINYFPILSLSKH